MKYKLCQKTKMGYNCKHAEGECGVAFDHTHPDGDRKNPVPYEEEAKGEWERYKNEKWWDKTKSDIFNLIISINYRGGSIGTCEKVASEIDTLLSSTRLQAVEEFKKEMRENPATVNLREHQGQADECGAIVTVSRQALDEVLVLLDNKDL